MKDCTELRVKRGGQYFGSGGYSAGYKVVEGEVESIPIADSEYDNGFVSGKQYLLRPKTDVAVVDVWCSDGISNSGHRSLGPEGLFRLVKDPNAEVPFTCPHCGHHIEQK